MGKSNDRTNRYGWAHRSPCPRATGALISDADCTDQGCWPLEHMPGCRCAEYWADDDPGVPPLLMVSERIWTSLETTGYPAASELLTFSLFDVLRRTAEEAGVPFEDLIEQRWNERGERIGPRSDVRICEMIEYRYLTKTVWKAIEETVSRMVEAEQRRPLDGTPRPSQRVT